MYNANDFFFDNKIRLAIERHTDLSFIPDWSKLEERLDIEMPVKKKRRRFIVFWFLFACLVAGSAYWGFDGNFNSQKNYANQTPTDTKQNIIAPAENGKKSSAKPQPEKIVTNYTDNVRKDTKPVKKIASLLPALQTISADPLTLLKKAKNSTPLTQPAKEQVSDVAVNNKVISKEISDEVLSGTDITIENKSSFSKETSNIPVKDTVTNTDLLKLANVTNIPKDTAGSIANNLKPVQKKSVTSRFSFAAVGGVNVNSVQLSKLSKPGYDYGLLLGYRISPKIEIRSGVILAKKYFTTSGNNISFDSAKLNLPSYNSISLENATGYCRFIEVPLMLYYQFSATKKTNLYTAGGFSIIKMRMDNIHYTFLADGNTLVQRSHSNAYHNSDGFSTSVTANFSLGVKQKITDRWSFVEPYIKLPLSRMNDSNLKFTTFGTLASFIYSLPARKRN
ncbi:MAG: outer membrane beta-barrel protein [Sediminibacterium sp.]|jgi:hypothetical protein|nr:outer membrane beta-barrel protein [Sediminibacterium sp.]MCA6438968.1 outer membrane beta-barrel protein [Chitinophagaceae bacterium]MCA6445620.1 outer membrane beta-barrel protein [Chitinophagaceae bacterium]